MTATFDTTYEPIDTTPFGITMTPLIREELMQMKPADQERWLKRLAAKDPWTLWKKEIWRRGRFYHFGDTAHLARLDGNMMETCCAKKFADLSSFSPADPDMPLCSNCRVRAEQNAVTLGSVQPRLR